jgi:hypothetical protein
MANGGAIGLAVRLVEHAAPGDVLEHAVERARVRPLRVRVGADERGDAAVVVGEVELAALAHVPDAPRQQHDQRRRRRRSAVSSSARSGFVRRASQ